jgi:hypothetical protein
MGISSGGALSAKASSTQQAIPMDSANFVSFLGPAGARPSRYYTLPRLASPAPAACRCSALCGSVGTIFGPVRLPFLAQDPYHPS